MGLVPDGLGGIPRIQTPWRDRAKYEKDYGTSPGFEGGMELRPTGTKSNPPFLMQRHDYLRDGVNQFRLNRGYMRRSSYGDEPWRFHFMWNPSVIQHNISSSGATYDSTQVSKEEKEQPFVGESAFSFAIMLDRQLEVAQGLDGFVGKGVLRDTEILQRMVGSVETADGVSGVVMSQRLVDVLFSADLMFQGRCDSININYSKFGVGFVPTVAEVSIGMVVKYAGPALAQSSSDAYTGPITTDQVLGRINDTTDAILSIFGIDREPLTQADRTYANGAPRLLV